MNKTVLITGPAGFIASHALEGWLAETDWNFLLLDGLSYAGKMKNLNHVIDRYDAWDRVKFIHHNLRSSLDAIDEDIKRGWPDYVVHFAASTHVERSIDNPYPFLMDNTVGTFNLLDYFRQNCWVSHAKDEDAKAPFTCPKIVLISTDEVYGAANEGQVHTELDRYNPRNPYAAAKAAGEMFGMAYRNTYDLDVNIVHAMNNFGERQDSEKFIPKTIRALLCDEIVTIHGTPGNMGSRMYLHARNFANGIKFVLDNTLPEYIFNIAGDVEVTNEEMVEIISKILNKPDYLKYYRPLEKARPGHDKRYAMSSELLESYGWKAPLSFLDSLENTVNWYLSNKEYLGL